MFKPRIDLPKFNGDNPRLWIRKCMKYLNFHPMSDHEKLFNSHHMSDHEKFLLVDINMEEEVDNWYLAYIDGREEIGWEKFASMVIERFSNVADENLIGKFNKLKQRGQ